jgi:calpain-15
VVRGGICVAFSRSYDKELWVLILEKAYAKAYGGYLPIEGGDPCYALRDLTGAPYARFDDFQDIDSLWQRLRAAVERNWIIACLTAPGKINEELRDTGVIGG